MARRRKKSRIEAALAQLAAVKGDFLAASRRAAERVRSCEGCDARCCRAGLNSMRISRIEALALAARLEEPDLEALVPEILERARREIDTRGLVSDPEATYDCPLLSPQGRCLVHGAAQPAGCHTFQTVEDGGCDHDLGFFAKNVGRIRGAERKAFKRVSEPLPIPLALVRVLGQRAWRS